MYVIPYPMYMCMYAQVLNAWIRTHAHWHRLHTYVQIRFYIYTFKYIHTFLYACLCAYMFAPSASFQETERPA